MASSAVRWSADSAPLRNNTMMPSITSGRCCREFCRPPGDRLICNGTEIDLKFREIIFRNTIANAQWCSVLCLYHGLRDIADSAKLSDRVPLIC